jgi:hypothetical protein
MQLISSINLDVGTDPNFVTNQVNKFAAMM